MSTLFPPLPTATDDRPHAPGTVTTCQVCFYAIQLISGAWITTPDGRADCHDGHAHKPTPRLTTADLPA